MTAHSSLVATDLLNVVDDLERELQIAYEDARAKRRRQEALRSSVDGLRDILAIASSGSEEGER